MSQPALEQRTPEPLVLVESAPDPGEPTAYSVLDGPDGRTIIHGDVVAKIAGVAVREIDGVHALAPLGAAQSVTALAKRIVGASMRRLGIAVEVGRRQAAIDVRLVTDHGASIPRIAHDIRAAIREDVEWMTGLDVVEINIEVVDLYFEKAGIRSRRRVD